MTADEKTAIARFLNLAADYLGDGHRREWVIPWVSDESGSAAEELSPVQANSSSLPSNNLSLTNYPSVNIPLTNLPLAYQVDEDEDEQPQDNPPDYSGDSLEAVAADVRACKACGLAPTRTLAVPGEGVECPLVMVIGEGPGADEDRSGRPFVGRAGQLLDRMLESIGLSRNKNCFIANIVKCRPPENREPAPEEVAACFPYLQRQIALLRPRIILCAGRTAAQNLFRTGMGISALRGAFREFKMNKSDGLNFKGNNDAIEETAIPVLCTFHPSALLRDESKKRPAWEDLKLLKAHLNSLVSLDGE